MENSAKRERERENDTSETLSKNSPKYKRVLDPFLLFLGKILREKTVGKGEKREKK